MGKAKKAETVAPKWCSVKPGVIVGIVKLTNLYYRGAHVTLEQAGFIEQKEAKKRGQHRAFKVLKELPTLCGLKKIECEQWTKTVEDWMDNCLGDIDQLHSDMEEWRDALGESEGLSQTDKYSEVEAAADEMESIKDDLPSTTGDIPDAVLAVKVYVCPIQLPISGWAWRQKRRTGRSWIASEVATIFEVIADKLEEQRPDDEAGSDEYGFRDSLRSAADQLGYVDFPGMF